MTKGNSFMNSNLKSGQNAFATAALKMVLVTTVAATFASVLAGCTKSGTPDLHKEPNIEVIQDMMEQPALKPQDFLPNDRTKASSRTPPDHTVAVGHKPYPYHLDAAAAAANLKNPLNGNSSTEILTLGRTKFETYCAVCHGYQGKGDGPVAPKMALRPPPLISEKIMKLNDAGIFHIITDGQGVMASYAYQLTEERDRWAIVNYVRSLQKMAAGGSTGK
jgi:mono/diheme cytochrome c family protein